MKWIASIHLDLKRSQKTAQINECSFQKLQSMRHIEINGLKVHPSVKFAVGYASAKMSENLKNQVFLHRKLEDVVWSKSLFPAEYRGVNPMNDMIEAVRLKLEAIRELFLKHDEMTVNLDQFDVKSFVNN